MTPPDNLKCSELLDNESVHDIRKTDCIKFFDEKYISWKALRSFNRFFISSLLVILTAFSVYVVAAIQSNAKMQSDIDYYKLNVDKIIQVQQETNKQLSDLNTNYQVLNATLKSKDLIK